MKLGLNKPNRKGIALIIVMISIFVLTILAGGFAYSMKVETQLAMHATDEPELQWIGRAGVEYCRWMLAQQSACVAERYHSLDQIWAGGPGGACATNGALADVQKEVKIGRGSFTWKIVDNERKWNINTMDEQSLQNALLLMGTDAGEITPVVNSILDWKDADDSTHPEGAESSHYENNEPPYVAKNGPIDSVTELMLINGVTPLVYYGSGISNNVPLGTVQKQFNRNRAMNQTVVLSQGMADLFTTVSAGKLNINTASVEALQIIPEMTDIIAQQIVEVRSNFEGPFKTISQQELMSRVPSLTLPVCNRIMAYCVVQSQSFEVEITATVGHSSRKFRATIIGLPPFPVTGFTWEM